MRVLMERGCRNSKVQMPIFRNRVRAVQQNNIVDCTSKLGDGKLREVLDDLSCKGKFTG
jgi:hypothetical protein